MRGFWLRFRVVDCSWGDERDVMIQILKLIFFFVGLNVEDFLKGFALCFRLGSALNGVRMDLRKSG